MTVVVFVLMALAGLSLGLRATSVLPGDRVHPLVRLASAIVVGAILTGATLELCESYHVLDMGVGLLLSLSPVGVFDLAKWWFRWRNRPPQPAPPTRH